MKELALAMRIYEGDHNMQEPTSLDQIIQSGALGSATNGFAFKNTDGSRDLIGMENFALMNVGLVSDNTPDKLLIREHSPRQDPGGGWMRVYAFADGSVHVQTASQGSFDDFEAQHSIALPTQ
jgi:hypothetical protein